MAKTGLNLTKRIINAHVWGQCSCMHEWGQVFASLCKFVQICASLYKYVQVKIMLVRFGYISYTLSNKSFRSFNCML